MRRVLAVLFVSALVAAACTGGGGEAEEQAAEPGRMNLYVVVHGGSGDPYWQVVRNGVDAAKERYGVDVTWLNPEQFSVAALVDLMESAVAAKPDGMIVTVTDYAALEPTLTEAIDQGIPVIAIDTPDPRPVGERIPYLFYVGTDLYLAGRRGAERMLAEGHLTRAACANHEIGNSSNDTGCQGFTDRMEEDGVTVDILDIGQDPTQAQEVLRGYVEANPDAGAIFTVGPLGAIPTIQFLTDAGLWGTVMHGSWDLDPTTLESIQNGETLFTTDAQPYLQGYMAVELMYLHILYGFTPATDILTGPAIIDASNVEQVVALSEDQIR